MKLSFKIILSLLFSSFALSIAAQIPTDFRPIKDTSELQEIIDIQLSNLKTKKSNNLDTTLALLQNAIDLEDTLSYFRLIRGVSKFYKYNSFQKEELLLLTQGQKILGPNPTPFGDINNKLGNCYRKLGLPFQALEYYFKSTEWHKKYSSNKISVPYGNIGRIYYTNKDFEKAHKFTRESIKYSLLIKNENVRLYNLSHTYAALGEILFKLQRFEEAEESFDLAIAAAEEHPADHHSLYSISRALPIWQKTGNTEKCRYWISVGEEYLKDEFNRHSFQGENFIMNKNHFYIDEGQIEKAQHPNEFTITNTFLKPEQLNYSISYFSKKKDYPKTIALYQELNKEKENAIIENRKKTLYSIEDSYTNKELKRKNEELIEIARQRKTTSSIGLVVLFVIFGFLMLQLHNNKRFKKLNKLLQTKSNELETSNKYLLKSNEELERFAFIASHDLKTPLRTIISFCGLMERELDSNPKKLREYLSYIKQAGSRMNTLIINVLEFSRLSYLEKEKNHEIVNSNKLIADVVLTFSKLIAEKNFEIVTLNDLPLIKAHKVSISTLFQNLIENSIKYNDSTVPMLKIYSKKHQNHLSIYFEDNGIGISEKYHNKIFVMFSRLHNHDEYEGTGLGLSTCKKIVESLNGDLLIKSKPGEGSTFEIQLPMEIIVSPSPNLVS